MLDSAPDFEPLADPSPLRHWLLEDPTAPLLVLLAAALVLWLVGRRTRQRRPAGIVSLALCALALAVFALTALVETPRERAIATSRQLFVGLAEANPQLVSAQLSPEAIARVPGGYAPDLTRDDLLDRVREAQQNAGRYSGGGWTATINSYRIRKVRAEAQPGRATAQVNAVFTLDEDGIPRGTWWELALEPDGEGGWRAREIELLWVAGAPGWGRGG